jgi:hypothetical protein
VLRLGLDPEAFAAAAGAAAQAKPSDDNADATAEANKDGTPPKQQEEQGRTVAPAPTTTIKRTAATPLLPLLACLRDGACPRLTTLDLDARLAPPIKNKSKKNDNEAEAAASSTTTTTAAPVVSPLTGEPLAALTTVLRQGKLRRLEVRIEGKDETKAL